MSVIGAVLGAKVAYIIEHADPPVCVLMHPLTLAKAEIEAWEREEEQGRYGPPTYLTHIHSLRVVSDLGQHEGDVWVGTAEDYEALSSGRLAKWHARNGMGG